MKTRPRTLTQGATLLEILIMLAMMGTLLGFGLATFPNWKRSASNEGFVTALSTDIATARARTLGSGTPYRILINSAQQYTVQRQSGASWTDVRSQSADQALLDVSVSAIARCLQFNGRGEMNAYSDVSCASATTNTTFTVQNTSTKQLLITALGMVNRS